MKNVLYMLSIVLSALYIFLFCFNVSCLVAKHMDFEIFYPLALIAFSILLFISMLVINKFNSFDKKLFLIPLLFFISAIITLIVGYYTPCEFCTL